MSKRPCIWLIEDGEPLPHSSRAPLLRTGRLAERLWSEGCEVHWFASDFDHGTRSKVQSGTRAINFKDHYFIHLLGGCGYGGSSSLKRVLHQHLTAFNFLRAAGSLGEPDLILAGYPVPELAAAAAYVASRRKIKFILDVRDVWPDTFADLEQRKQSPALAALTAYYNRLLRFALGTNTAAVVSMSSSVLKWARDKAASPPGSLDRVFYLGSSLPIVGPENRAGECFSPERPLTVAFYTTLGQSHDGEVVLRAAREIFAEAGTAVRFVFIGDGDLRRRYESLSRDLPSIIFTGWKNQQETSEILRQSHIGLVTTSGLLNKYWLGNKLFDYVNNSLAIVFDVGGELREIIDGHSAGLPFVQGDSNSLVAVLRKLLASPSKVSSCMANSHRLARTLFCNESIMDGFARFLVRSAQSNEVAVLISPAKVPQ